MRSAAGTETSGSRGESRRTIEAFMAANIARKRYGGFSAGGPNVAEQPASARSGTAPKLRATPVSRRANGCEPLPAGAPAAGLPARRRARPRPRGSNQLVIASHFLAARALQSHGDLAIEG